MKLDDIKSVYFLGIGGIGMSALARFFMQRGVAVSGYDRTEGPVTIALQAEGARIHYTESIDSIPANLDLAIFTPAIPSTHSEFLYIKNSAVPLLKRAEVLGIISQSHFTIAVAGTHGKTSTTALIGHILKSAKINVTAFVGGICTNYQSNYITSPQTDVVVVEADEFDRSFLYLHPDIAIITSMDSDHMDVYKSHDELLKAFHTFANQTRDNGLVLYRSGLPLRTNTRSEYFSYDGEDSNYRILSYTPATGFYTCDLKLGKTTLSQCTISFPGRHNLSNALVAAAAALHAGAKPLAIKEALASFKGVWRRFEYHIKRDNMVYIDDYAHHPSELDACINATRELYPKRKITGIFQPHLFSRTKDYAAAFAASLDQLDRVILLPIYPARETPIKGVSSAMIMELMHNNNVKLIEKEHILDELSKEIPEVLVTLGAGDIDRLIEPITNFLNKAQ